MASKFIIGKAKEYLKVKLQSQQVELWISVPDSNINIDDNTGSFESNTQDLKPIKMSSTKSGFKEDGFVLILTEKIEFHEENSQWLWTKSKYTNNQAVLIEKDRLLLNDKKLLFLDLPIVDRWLNREERNSIFSMTYPVFKLDLVDKIRSHNINIYDISEIHNNLLNSSWEIEDMIEALDEKYVPQQHT